HRGGREHRRAKVAPTEVVDQVSPAVCLLRPHNREVAGEWLLENMVAPTNRSHLLIPGNFRCRARGGEEPPEASTTGTEPLTQGCLRHDFKLDPAFLPGLLKPVRSTGARIAADNLSDAAFADERRDPRLPAARVVRHYCQIGDADVEQ